jgi:hypothetical protein
MHSFVALFEGPRLWVFWVYLIATRQAISAFRVTTQQLWLTILTSFVVALFSVWFMDFLTRRNTQQR